MNENTINIIGVNRDAVASNRGFYFQYLIVLKKWIKNFIEDKNIAVFTEVGDDIKEVGDKLIFTQLKCYTNSFSFKSKEVVKALYNFFVQFLIEKDNVAEIRFFFETNTSLKSNEKLLKEWAEQQSHLSNEVKQRCVVKLKSLLFSELKNHRNKSLQIAGSSKKEEIKNAYEDFQSYLTDSNIEAFISCIGWHFSNVSPEQAINENSIDILNLLKHEKFEQKPINILFNVLISEIYRCSQNKNESDRVLYNSTILSLLQKTDEELNKYIDQRFLALFNTRLNSIYIALNELQKEQVNQRKEINALKDTNKQNLLPKELSLSPILNSKIINRDTDIDSVHDLLLNNKNLLLWGVGGIGKSTTANLYKHKYGHLYSHIIWLNVDGDLANSLMLNESISCYLNFSGNENKNITINKIAEEINQIQGLNLLIIDDFDESYNVLSVLLQLKNWRIIITSRNLIKNLSAHKINEFNFEEACDLYKYYDQNTEVSEEALRVFFEYIDYNTLMIELVGKTISNSLDLSLPKFIQYMEEQRLDDLELDIDIEILTKDEVTRLLPFLLKTFSFSKLTDQEKYILTFLSLLPANEIQITDLIEWAGAEFEKKNKLYYTNITNALHRKGWIERNNNSIKINKTIQEAIIYRERKEASPFLSQVFMINWLARRLREGFSSDPRISFKFLKYGESILTKIKEQCRKEIYQPLLILENEVLVVYNWLDINGNLLDRWENFTQRAFLYLSANTNLSDDSLLSTIYNNYALALGKNQKYDLAEKYFNASIKLSLKENLISTLLVANINLAMLYLVTNNLDQFTKTVENITNYRKQNKLVNDPTVPLQFNMLAIISQQAGNISLAINLLRIAIDEYFKMDKSSRNDLTLVYYYNNLSFNLLVKDLKEEAIVYLTKSLSILDSIKFPDKRLIKIILYSLYDIYKKIGDEKNINLIEKRLSELDLK